ncbi:sigma-70 family RNA polymerase sigma factor [Corynebacterium propinquum]|uniref:RNA polymerase sigma factor n=1 Tax=Corynebacterium propinquum TaxID=43769 RepID=UPI00037FB219|nr:sigma-70 family RNA polymerase sigma factor [Corynebacterium propinquum]MCT1819020.1 sigma-70 family RNA polymerase sigma factor [Corynebacterium propinquum]MDK4252684.1 sigma-70 family RNA polymerase sigma factor [Corynebacterium propinquum]MDK4291916.1 sigma-70 family RNA polymerase sigma factor [Corynebacterium propinquum]MDK4319666.1 sigma-70 family RNA polymerase sigma factor [Corynebacterium propinquum]MDK8723830.1 sigma-70 family RNA polymerase sigma factor [Corynebacterium propinquu
MTSDSRSPHDQAAFTTIYREHYPQILAYLRRRVAAAAAEEYCADVFGRAWANFSSLHNPQRPLPWLYGIAGNVVKEYYRGKSSRQDHVEEEAELDQIAADDFSQVADLSLDINRALNTLPFADRDIIALHAWEQLSIPDIAASLGITENNARVKLHRARTRLKEALEPENLGQP